jgi:hypothetical protein
MSINYTTLIGDPTQIVQFNTTDPTLEYPDTSTVSILGTVYLPKVYGKNLTAFEIASSGKIAITINDYHTFDIIRNNTLSNTTFNAVNGESLEFAVNQKSAGILINGSNNNLEFYSKNKIILGASNGVYFSASNNANFDSASNLYFTASNDMFLTAGRDTYITSLCNIFMSAAGGAVKFALDPPNANIYFTASNNIDFNSADGSINLYAQHSNVYIKMTDTMDLDLYATSNFSLYANDSNVSILANSNNLNLSACNINITGDLTLNKIIQSNINICYKFSIGNQNELELIRITSSNNIIIDNEVITRYITKSMIF